MAYKTLMIKLYNPTKSKRKLFDNAILRYTNALQFLLDHYHDELLSFALSEQTINRTVLLKMLDKDVLKELNQFEVEPFKDSLKIEFAAIGMNYISQHRSRPSTNFPKLNSMEGDCSQADGSEISPHPVYFGRYAVNRDFCLLYNRSTGRFYAKLYLLNAKNKLKRENEKGKLQLQYIAKGMPDVPQQTDGMRFVIVPLAFGRHQLCDLNRLLEDPGLAKTARLKKLKGEYYLLVTIECDLPQKATVSAFLGVVRSLSGGLHYTVCNKEGFVIESGIIDKPAAECQKLFLLAKAILQICRKYHPQVVVEGNGGKNDKLLYKKVSQDCPLTTTEYMRFVKILSYKLPGEGLPQPIELSANRLFNSCPACFITSQKSRISPQLFICVKCGYASSIESVGSLSLIHKLQKYQSVSA